MNHDFGNTSRHVVHHENHIFIWRIVVYCLVALVVSLILTLFAILRLSSWHADQPVTIALVSPISAQSIRSHITIIKLDPTLHQYLRLRLPGAMAVRLPQYGVHTLDTAYGLFGLDHRPPDDFLRSLSFALGIDVRELIVLHQSVELEQVNSTVFWNSALSRGSESTSDFATLFREFWYVRTINKNEQESITIPDRFFTSKFIDGQTVLVPDEVSFSNFLSKIMRNDAITTENISIAVVNSSGVTGAGASFGKFLTNIGGFLLSIDDTSSMTEDSHVTVADGKLLSSKTAELLSRYAETKPTLDNAIANQYRADIVVFVGKKLADKLTP